MESLKEGTMKRGKKEGKKKRRKIESVYELHNFLSNDFWILNRDQEFEKNM